jgi:hypothetical protein
VYVIKIDIISYNIRLDNIKDLLAYYGKSSISLRLLIIRTFVSVHEHLNARGLFFSYLSSIIQKEMLKEKSMM